MEWHYSNGTESTGPVTEPELMDLKASGQVNDDTLVWRAGFGDWMSYSQAFGISTILTKSEKYVACAVCENLNIARSGKLIIIRRNVRLPLRCIKCNALTSSTVKRKLYWHTPWLFLLILIQPLFFLIAVFCFRKKAEIEIPLCDWHVDARNGHIAMAWAICIGAIPCLFFAHAMGLQWAKYLTIPTILFGMLYGIFRSRIVRAASIDKEFIRLRGGGRDFLDSLPEWKDQPQARQSSATH